MSEAKALTKSERINKERKRLEKLYSDLPKDVIAVYEGLINRAAYVRVTLEDYEADINEHGSVESFSQSPDLEPYERGRPVVGFYNTMSKNYLSILKQLAERLPEPSAADPSEEIMRFAIGGRK